MATNPQQTVIKPIDLTGIPVGAEILTVASWKRGFARLGLELGYFTGIARLLTRNTGGIGIILKFSHVRPFEPGHLDPGQSITPRFLDQLLGALREWNFDIISLDEVLLRLAGSPNPRRRFVCLTFDGGYRDFLDHAWPQLARHHAPFALFVPSNAPDGLAELWWLALERIIRENSRIGLLMDGQEKRFHAAKLPEKRDLYGLLHGWLRSQTQDVRSSAVADLCRRYRVDARAFCREQCLSWQELNDLSASPLATIGTATASYPVLSRCLNDTAENEMRNGRIAMEASLGQRARHFAYPFGDHRSFGRRHAMMASQLGFATAATSEPGVIMPGATDLMRLPRIAWDGRRQSLRPMRVILSGITVGGRTPKAMDD